MEEWHITVGTEETKLGREQKKEQGETPAVLRQEAVVAWIPRVAGEREE